MLMRLNILGLGHAEEQIVLKLEEYTRLHNGERKKQTSRA